MAGNDQQQQNQKSGNQQKAIDGIQLGLNIGTGDLSKDRMSNVFIIGLMGILGAFGIAHLASPIKQYLFGIENPNIKAPIKFGDVLEKLKGGDTKDSERKWAMKEAFGVLPEAEQKAMVEWFNKQGDDKNK